MPAYTQPHRKQLIGEYVYAFSDLQLFYTPSCSKKQSFHDLYWKTKVEGIFIYINVLHFIWVTL